ncbi:MAG TPA: hypothetical protein VGL61_35260 [Kofleriaceae bacterium]
MRWCAVGVTAAMSFALPAHADRATADELAAQAAKLASSGDYAGAAVKFRAAFAADPRPELTCNIGVAYYKRADLPRADRYLNECVKTGGGLDAAFLARVHSALEVVESDLLARDVTPLDLDVEPQTATLELDAWPDEPIIGPHRVWVEYGHHVLTIEAPGFVTQTVDLDATSHAPVVRRVVLVPVQAETHPVAMLPVAPTRQDRGTPRLAEGLLVTGGVLAVAGVVLHVSAAEVRSDLETSSVNRYDDNVSKFELLRALAITSYALAGVTAGIGGYLFYRHSRERGPIVGATVAPGLAAISVEWRQ